MNIKFCSFFLSMVLQFSPLCGKDEPKGFLNESKEYGKIIGLATASAIGYGLVQDQITARVCLEYFTKGFHEQMVHTWKGVPIFNGLREILLRNQDSPTITAGIWGVVATWWVGLPLGVALALSARAGKLPKIKAEDLKSKILKSLAITGASSFIAGLIGYVLVNNNYIKFYDSAIRGVPQDKMAVWGADYFAHEAAYSVGVLTGLGMCALILKERYDLSWEQAMKDQEERLIKMLKSDTITSQVFTQDESNTGIASETVS